MEEVHELGGGIILLGFDVLDRDEQLIIKKIVGSYVKDFCKVLPDYKSLEVQLEKNDASFDLEVKLINESGIIKKVESKENVFVGLDGALKKVEKAI